MDRTRFPQRRLQAIPQGIVGVYSASEQRFAEHVAILHWNLDGVRIEHRLGL